MRCGFWVFLFWPISGFQFCPNFLCGFAVLGDFFFGFAVYNIPQCPPLYKSLGVSVDEDLTWKAHIEEISKKKSAGLSALKRISPTIPFETRQIMYKALILPYFDYSSCV